MFIQNFLLSTAKRELSPQLHHLPDGTINHTINTVMKEIDSIVFKHEGMSTKEFLTPRRYTTLQVILSYLVQEGFSQVSQKRLSEKSGISLPLINEILRWLEDLEICHQIKIRRHGKIAPSIYILSLHNNYLKIIEYFKQKWAYTIDMFATFTEFLSKKISGNTDKKKEQEEERPTSICHGFDLFTPVKPTEVEAAEYEASPSKEQKLTLRFQEMDEHMSDDQKKLYMYILTQDTNITEKDAYTIALRMPTDVDWEIKKTFEECVNWYKHSQADISTPAHFLTMYTKKLRAYRNIRKEKYKKDRESTINIDFKKFKEMLDPNS
ncbi:winged helix-turn-helix domain-containing protein [Bacillus thuringiensis]|uniref:Replicase RepFR55 n=1 Tax=Bacillus thuringiensis subsp. higo TaxID=132266 RepID=A0A9X6LD65_BACUH|nr:winged helix-turn-helix domain-containing protein [Bacillus thuringiensis]OUB39972.1 Replicase RepFR55 [Bacillus thuringiensis serovar higo]